jgi:hypothetical protein
MHCSVAFIVDAIIVGVDQITPYMLKGLHFMLCHLTLTCLGPHLGVLGVVDELADGKDSNKAQILN